MTNNATGEIRFSPPKSRNTKLYMVLDCETATMPFVTDMKLNEKQKTTIATSFPLIYDLAWRIIDRKGNIYSQHSFLINEIFMVPTVFNTAYYHEKRPIYLEKLRNGIIKLVNWNDAVEVLLSDLFNCYAFSAYNAAFDTKALKFTDQYIANLLNPNYQKWEDRQKERAKKMLLRKKEVRKGKERDKNHFIFRNYEFTIIDLWGASCAKLNNTATYKKHCLENGAISPSGLFFKTSAEQTFREQSGDYAFIEAHTALEDVIIESGILTKIARKGALPIGLVDFPFRELGRVTEFLMSTNFKFSYEIFDQLKEIYEERLEYYKFNEIKSWASQMQSELNKLERARKKNLKKVKKSVDN